MSETTGDTPTETETETQSTETGDTPTIETLQAEVEKWKAQSRKHEQRAKDSAGAQKELDALKAQHMSETDKAIAQAKAEARTEALAEAGAKIARAEFKAAVGERLDDDGFDALLEGLDLKAFLDDNGDVDTSKIRSFVDRVVPKQEVNGYQPPDLGQGSRGTKATGSKDPLLATVESLAGITR